MCYNITRYISLTPHVIKLIDFRFNNVRFKKPSKANMNKYYKTRKKIQKNSITPKISRFINGISPKTIKIMNLFLFPLALAFVYIGISFYSAAKTDIIMATDDFYPIFEHLMVSLTIVICGSALLDLSLRESEDRQ